MGVTACPTVVVATPIAAVWRLLADPELYPAWIDAELRTADPPGRVIPGQRIEMRTRALGRRWPVRFTVGDLEPSRSLALTVRLPLGIVNHEVIRVTPIPPDQCRVTFT